MCIRDRDQQEGGWQAGRSVRRRWQLGSTLAANLPEGAQPVRRQEQDPAQDRRGTVLLNSVWAAR